jgi:hypothetical protein
MKKVVEEFTGTIGVGCLVMLAFFFATDSIFRYWHYIEVLTNTNSWSILISVPILIVNYILGIIVIEIGELLIPKYYKTNVHNEFDRNMKTVVDKDNDFLSSRYSDVCQSKRVLNGSSLAFVLLGVGVFFEGLPLDFGYKIIGIIGMAGSLSLAAICPFISVRIQQKFNRSVLNMQTSP